MLSLPAYWTYWIWRCGMSFSRYFTMGENDVSSSYLLCEKVDPIACQVGKRQTWIEQLQLRPHPLSLLLLRILLRLPSHPPKEVENSIIGFGIRRTSLSKCSAGGYTLSDDGQSEEDPGADPADVLSVADQLPDTLL